ncbi:MAG: BON domain-containing protein [Rhizobium sp.]|nr:BON domain-containing protein [Rhizobium sp.]
MTIQNDDADLGRRHAPNGHYTPGESGFVDRSRDDVEPSETRDQRILGIITAHLRDDPTLDASAIHLDVENGDVTLSGLVTDNAERLRAEAFVLRTAGVKHVMNDLEIRISGEGSVMTQA